MKILLADKKGFDSMPSILQEKNEDKNQREIHVGRS
jgi:hypothetical protein